MRNQLLDLPDELLLEILSYLDLDRENRVTGHIEDEPPLDPPDLYLLEDFYIHNHALCSIALTCKRLSHLAQENLFCAPIVGDSSPVSSVNFPHSRVCSFVYALVARPRLRNYVKQLRVTLPSSKEVSNDRFIDFRGLVDRLQLHLDNSNGTFELVEGGAMLNTSDFISDRWDLQTYTYSMHALIGLLRALLPRLEKLCISEKRIHFDQPQLGMYDLSGLSSGALVNNVWKSLSRASSVQALGYLKVVNFLPITLSGLDLFPNLLTLDISARLALLPRLEILESSAQCVKSETRDKLRSIKNLRVDFRASTIGTWNATARYCIQNIIRGFWDLDSLDIYAEPSYNKNPYRSVRSFPHYQMNIQNYPDNSTDPGTEAQYWDERVYHARTRITEYQTLVDGLVHLRPRLKKLRLPGGFWTLPGGLRKPLPRFDQFTQLEILVVPQAAIICIKLDNMRFQHVAGDFDLSPAVVLPPRLRRLRIFDADAGFLESAWLHKLFIEQRYHFRWPRMQELEISFSLTNGDVDLKALTKKLQAKLRGLVEEVSFKVICGRDDEVPSLSIL